MALGVLILILVGVGAVIIITIRQRRHTPSTYPVSLEMRPRTEIIEEISHQRTATAVLRDSVCALMQCQYKILVVENDMDTRLLWRLNFKHDSRYAFFFAETGDEALQMVSRVMFDMIIFDPQLSDIQGNELIDRLIASGDLPLCLVVTAVSDERLRQKLMTLNIPVMSKPINFVELRQMITLLFLQETTPHDDVS
jgi:CheY-like chemotaxis protein